MHWKMDVSQDVQVAAEGVALPSHGENRGSSPLGSANDFSILAPKWSLGWPASPTFLQWTVRFRRSVRGHAVVGSRRPETIWAITAVGGIDAYFLTLTHARIAAFPAEQIEHPPVYEKTERAVQSSLCRRACRQVESRRAEAEKNRVTSVSSRNQASYSEPPGMTTTSPGPQTCCAEAELHHPESSSQCEWIPDLLVAAQRRRHSLLHAPESHPANT
jgi:hypothetical protein